MHYIVWITAEAAHSKAIIQEPEQWLPFAANAAPAFDITVRHPPMLHCHAARSTQRQARFVQHAVVSQPLLSRSCAVPAPTHLHMPKQALPAHLTQASSPPQPWTWHCLGTASRRQEPGGWGTGVAPRCCCSRCHRGRCGWASAGRWGCCRTCSAAGQAHIWITSIRRG